jgi:hypothetical protein
LLPSASRRSLHAALRFVSSIASITVSVLILLIVPSSPAIIRTVNHVLVDWNVRLVDGDLIVGSERLGGNGLGFQFVLD